MLRSNFHSAMNSILSEKRFSPKRILDIGSAGGLSVIKLCETFPDAEIIGIDLSPYMLAGNCIYTKLLLIISHPILICTIRRHRSGKVPIGYKTSACLR
jgi:SAM-dependent methyltransferase